MEALNISLYINVMNRFGIIQGFTREYYAKQAAGFSFERIHTKQRL